MLDHIVVVAQAKAGLQACGYLSCADAGRSVPDFALRNQDGRAIHLGQFKGKMLLLTFIYTRCPLPNFCPLVTHNFAVIEKQLADQPRALCQDAPAVRELRSGTRYAGEAAGLWRDVHRQRCEERIYPLGFCDAAEAGAAGDGEVLRCGNHAGANDTITHTLSTTLIGADGKVVQFYPGNEWTPEQVMADVKKSAGKAG